MRKILITLLALLLVNIPANADNIKKILNSKHLNPDAISISVKEVDSGNVVYSLNPKTPKNPASTLKVLTTAAVVDTLGSDYKYNTKLYKSTNNDLYLKLGADPFLKSSDLKSLMKTARAKNIKEPKKVYIDSSGFDSVEWGEGWQWDDELNPLMPKISIYNIDGNLLNVEILPVKNGTAPSIIIKPFYPATIMNLLNTDFLSGDNNIVAERNNNISPNIINLSGVVSSREILRLPVNNPKIYFDLRLNEAIQSAKIDYDGTILNAKLPDKNIYLVDEINNELNLSEVLKNSNNLVAETNFKLAGAKFANGIGTLANSQNMLKSYLGKLNLNSEDIRIVDGSGVSKNNLVTADFMTDFLIRLYKQDNFEQIKSNLPTSGEGTLKNRMLYFKDNLYAKTGTLANSSAIVGYLTTRKGKVYAFDIMIQDVKTSNIDKKDIEEQILRQIYMN